MELGDNSDLHGDTVQHKLSCNQNVRNFIIDSAMKCRLYKQLKETMYNRCTTSVICKAVKCKAC